MGSTSMMVTILFQRGVVTILFQHGVVTISFQRGDIIQRDNVAGDRRLLTIF